MEPFEKFAGNMSWDKEEFFALLRDFIDGFIEIFPTFWNFALFTVDKNPITVGKLVIGISFVIAGYIAIRLIVSYFERKILSRLDIEVPKRYTIKIFLFYSLLSLLFLFTLYLIEVPLTVFTVIGGALALGVGFGARNIMNNFISGMVIVVEHPIRVGDLIEVDQIIGVVEHIGFRASAIRSLNNTHYLIPNSAILEKNVLNWTLSNKVVRSEVVVGVVYGSPTAKARELLLKAAEDHKDVLGYSQSQKPIVFFSDFGDSALIFRLSYWMAVNTPLDLKRVASDLRFSIDHLFREAGIVIAFPQRDLHVKGPVSVQMLSSEKTSPPPIGGPKA